MTADDIRQQYMTSHDRRQQYYDISWQKATVHDITWQMATVYDSRWQKATVYDSRWHLPASSFELVSLLECWQYALWCIKDCIICHIFWYIAFFIHKQKWFERRWNVWVPIKLKHHMQVLSLKLPCIWFLMFLLHIFLLIRQLDLYKYFKIQAISVA